MSECGKTCTGDSDCRVFESCKRFPEGRVCARRGTGDVGDSCTRFLSCGDQRACLPWSGGYCARAGCIANVQCETGSFCVPVDGGFNACVKSCWESDDLCRAAGYACDITDDAAGATQLVCLPS